MVQLGFCIAIAMVFDGIMIDLQVLLKMNVMGLKINEFTQKNVSFSLSDLHEFWFVINDDTE